MTGYTLSTDETVITTILRDAACYSPEAYMSPKDLIAKCLEHGLKQEHAIEEALISLIDNDIIDYEMDNDNQVSQLWLID